MLLSNCVVCDKRKLRGPLNNCFNKFEMNKIVNNLLLGGDMFMPEMHLRKPGFTYSACGPFTKHRERIRKFRETSNLKHLYRNELACFVNDAAYFDKKDLAKRTILGKVLKFELIKLL